MSRSIDFGLKLGLPRTYASRLAALKSPEKIQDFVSSIPTNFELGGETNQSVVETLRRRKAHCLEGAFVAACALWMQGQPPLLMNIQAQGDDDHAVTLFRFGQHWGAISKSNHIWLRWRDPVYRNMRELAMSYFHEYVRGPSKTMDGYSRPFDLRRFDPSMWVTNTGNCIDVALALANARHFKIIETKQSRKLRPRDKIEIRAGKILEHPAPNQRLAKRY